MSEDHPQTRAMAITPPAALGQHEETLRKQKDYELEKKMGRRLPNGNHCLKRLTPRHMKMIGAHLNGESNREIAAHFGVHEMTVGRILRDPMTEQYILDARENYDVEVKGLVGLAIEVVRTALRADDTDLALKGVDKLEKLNKMLNPDVVIASINPDDAGKTDDAVAKFLGNVERLANAIAPILPSETPGGEKDGSTNGNGDPEDADFVIEGEGRNLTATSEDEHAASPGQIAGSSTKGSPS